MSDEDEWPFIVCMRRRRGRPEPVPTIPSREAYCNYCGEPVWVADSSPQGRIICMECAEQIDGEVEIRVTEKQRVELREQGIDDEKIDRVLSITESLRRWGLLSYEEDEIEGAKRRHPSSGDT